MPVKERLQNVAHQKRVSPLLTYFFAFIVVLLAGCSSTGEVPTPQTSPVTTHTPAGIILTIEPTSIIPSPSEAPATISAETTLIAITPSYDSTSFPNEVVIVLHQEGGFAGLDQTWTVYQDGRIEMNGELSGQLSAQELAFLLNSIDQSGFFEFDHPESGPFCCDFFTFTITATVGDRSNSISVSDGNPDLPANINEIISVLLQSLYP
jgi:hypothetical protein